ncbi:nuclear GTPase SLIP-GC-like [Boleophthalmus pectinirostris]|uniref:nuclear GTPase SLIP-GC-like n=1 Tax=Boleophthalmus pectinirostris TaxID=150288 RepID=UPI002432ACE7|nr:nuclear GTPase SLIP-GC-like [Boleophthalmus pectinirostris]
MEGVRITFSYSENTKLNEFLRKKIRDLGTEKKNLVGVFGKTGSGKSSLINAVVKEKGLLTIGEVQACTTVMTKVEANTQNNTYEAEIEFISKEEWEDEVKFSKDLLKEQNTDDEEYEEYNEKMTALYGDEWKDRSPENLMEPKYFKEIGEFLENRKKMVQVKLAKTLAKKILKYTRSDPDKGKGWFWPLVKCVTVKVPNCEILKHVTLVDLPGNGDCNKSRDQMWKKIVASCSTVCVVSEITRPASDRDAWEILERTCDLMGNGGECQKIYFICTKCDEGDNKDLTRNLKAKDAVKKKFNKLDKVKKQFKDDSFEVFTVSSKDFFTLRKHDRDQTEIPRLQQHLQNLNNQHEQTLNYVHGAFGILSLIKGAKLGNMDSHQTAQVFENLTGIIQRDLQKVQESMLKVFQEFNTCLSEGVKESKIKCEEALNKALNPKQKSGFYLPLRMAMENSGIHKKKRQIDLNATLSSPLTESIDEKFRETFPNDTKSGPLYEVIRAFSLDINKLIQQHQNFELHLTFISSEVTKVTTKVCQDILHRKKIIYSSLTETVKETMQECYKEAADHRGPGSLNNMKDTVEKHLKKVKNTMFDKAKDKMLALLKKLMDDVQKQLWETLQESIDTSFNPDQQLFPDFENEFELVKKHYDDLRGPKEEDVAKFQM